MADDGDDDVGAMPDAVVVGEAASHGGLFGLVFAALAGLVAAVVLRGRRRGRG